MSRLLQLLDHQSLAIKVPCLRTIGNILSGTEEDCNVFVRAGLLDILNRLIQSTKKSVRKEIVWAVSNITAGTVDQIQLCIQSGMFDKLVCIIKTDDIEIKRPGVKTTVNVGLSPEEEIVQDSLKAAMDAANELGNQKLADQIGNSITFFTRTHVVER